MLIDFVTDYDHGILVIERLGSQALHDDWDVMALGAHAVPDSLYVAVLPPMEGRVSVTVRDANESETDESPLLPLFQGRLLVQTGVLLVGDSDRNLEVRVPVSGGSVEVSVLVDEVGLASRVAVVLGSG